MQHVLYDDAAGKTITLTCDGMTLTTTTDTDGKTKSTSKTFTGEEDVMLQLVKKEWDLMKKGAIMRAATAPTGYPLLHIYTGRGYTGCLSFEATPHGIYVYRPGNEERDELLRITADGRIAEVLTLPRLLAWEMWYDPLQNQLLMDLDHYIYTYDFASATFTPLTSHVEKPASFASVAGNTWAYGTHPSYYISHHPHDKREAFPLDVSFIQGSIPICAALSPDGQLLALHDKEGEVRLISTADYSVVNTFKGDFKKAEKMIWTRDSSQLIVQDKYVGAALRFFELATGEEVSYEGLVLPTYSQDVHDFCLNADNSLLVCAQRARAFVFDFVNKTFLYSLPLFHTVKSTQIRFVDDKKLGVRTDYGCFSIYQL